MRSYLKQLILSVIVVSSGYGCASTSDEQEVVYKDYNLEKPEKFNMPESLLEISGIAFNKGNPDTVYAIQDEDGRVYRLGWGNPRQYHVKFGKKGDYEDISILRDKVIVLKSNGSLSTFPLSEVVAEEPEQVMEYKKIVPKGEYESLFGDEASGKLYMLCKNCEADKSGESVSGYIIDLDKDPEKPIGTFSIRTGEINALNGKKLKSFRPSGLAKHPLTNDWYIVSAVNKMLVVTDKDWKVKEVFPLDGNIFIQPEGIAFDSSGNLYISNEGDDLFSGNILKFKKLSR